ncbi:MAG: hypothetical protein Q4D60_05780 [Eubacteriales bacterium]|nr:hypothetical protein [Eubacteriales bacterium]
MNQKTVLQKLKSRRGESLAEALIACLLGGMALLILSVMIQTSTKMIADGAKKAGTDYEAINQLEERNTGITTTEGELTVTWSPEGSTGAEATTATTEIPIQLYEEGGMALYDEK